MADRCAVCNKQFHGLVDQAGQPVPREPGLLVVCTRCGAFLSVPPQGPLRELTALEEVKLNRETLRALEVYRAEGLPRTGLVGVPR